MLRPFSNLLQQIHSHADARFLKTNRVLASTKRQLAIEHLEQRHLLAAYSLLPDAIDGSGDSLRDAITSANSNGQDDVITLAAGVYRLSGTGTNEDHNATGDLDFTEAGHAITIVGRGADSTFLSAEFLADRVLDIHKGVTLILIGVTVQDGTGVYAGGGLKNLGSLKLVDSVVTGNSADIGGGIFNAGDLSLHSSSVTNNDARHGGGGIYSEGLLWMAPSVVSKNRSTSGEADVWRAEPILALPYFPSLDDEPLLVSDVSVHDWGGGAGYVDGDYGWAAGSETLSATTAESGLTRHLPRSAFRHLPGAEEFQPGTLTAGSIDDHKSFGDFKTFLKRTLQGLPTQYPEIDLGDLSTIWVTNSDGVGVGDALITVHALDAAGNVVGDSLLQVSAGTDGRALFSTGIDGVSATAKYSVSVTSADGAIVATEIFDQREELWNITLSGAAAVPPTQLDIALVIDTTGSMGDELKFLKVEIDSIVRQVRESYPDVDMRFSMVSYRDHGDAYVTRTFEFTGSIDDFREDLERQFASGGGDYPEAMHLAMEEALDFEWREENTAKMLFLVADAPPHHQYASRTIDTAHAFRDKGVRVYPVAASGVADAAEYVMRTTSFLTQGEYLFLTDNSGVGNPHAQPDVAQYDVERLDQLMYRMIAGELSGSKVPAQDIIETVVFPTFRSETYSSSNAELLPELTDDNLSESARKASLLLLNDSAFASISQSLEALAPTEQDDLASIGQEVTSFEDWDAVLSESDFSMFGSLVVL